MLVDGFTQTPSRERCSQSDALGPVSGEDIARQIRFEMGRMTHPVALSEGPHQVPSSISFSVSSAISTVVVGMYSELCCTGSVAGAADPECFLNLGFPLLTLGFQQPPSEFARVFPGVVGKTFILDGFVVTRICGEKTVFRAHRHPSRHPLTRRVSQQRFSCSCFFVRYSLGYF